MSLTGIIVSGVLVNNFVFSRFLGLCPFIGVSSQLETAVGMSMAVIFVMALSSCVTWLFRELLLVPYGLQYLETVAFILVIAALVQFVEMAILKNSPLLYRSLGIYLPLITTNCAVLGVVVLNVRTGYGLVASVTNGIAGALGWSLAIILFAGLRERLQFSDVPEVLRGFPVALISAGLISIAFSGFQRLFGSLVR